MIKQAPIIVLFSQDLRLSDNPALFAAANQKAPLVLLYVYDEISPGLWKMGGAQKVWLHESLVALQKDLLTFRQTLVLRKGALHETIDQVVKESKACAVYFNRRYEPWNKPYNTIETKSFNASLLVEPWEIKTKTGEPFKVFTPFWKTFLYTYTPRKPLPLPSLPPCSHTLKSESLDSWQLQPHTSNWGKKIINQWKPGEKEASKKLKNFIAENMKDYHEDRNFPYIQKGTSKLSPYLRMGQISPHQIWDQVERKNEGERLFLSELGWREFSYHLLYHFPFLPKENFNQKFDRFPWKSDSQKLSKWQKGITGYPIVDAGMRQLWHTGWMHNRVRMIVASFLTKDLFIHWTQGALWFWETLVDADLANNSASWQWVAGCGADAAPYFRIFNPTLQSKKFDPEGKYLRQWVTELSTLDDTVVHNPPLSIRQEIDYPEPIVDHAKARLEALSLFQKIKTL